MEHQAVRRWPVDRQNHGQSLRLTALIEASVRQVGAGDLMEAIQSFEAESSETGDSRTTLSR